MTDLDKKLDELLKPKLLRLFTCDSSSTVGVLQDTKDEITNAIKSLIKEEAERHANEVIGLDSDDRWTDNEVWLETRDLQRQEQRQRNNYQVKGER